MPSRVAFAEMRGYRRGDAEYSPYLYPRRSKDKVSFIVLNGEPLFYRVREGPYFPTLRVLHQCAFLCWLVAHGPSDAVPGLCICVICQLPCARLARVFTFALQASPLYNPFPYHPTRHPQTRQ